MEYVWGGGDVPLRVTAPDGTLYDAALAGDGALERLVVGGETTLRVRRDALGRLASVSNRGGTRSFRYDGAGQITRETTEAGTTDYAYDAAGRVTRIRTDAGLVQTYGYDAAGRLTSVRMGETGDAVAFEYDRGNRITGVEIAPGRKLTVERDANGRPARWVYPGGLLIERTYYPSELPDSEAPIETETGLDGTSWTFAYGETGDLVQVSGADGVTTYTYGPDLRLETIVDALDRITRFQWTHEGNLARLTTPEGRVERWERADGGGTERWKRADGTEVVTERAPGRIVRRLPSGEIHELARSGNLTTESGGSGGEVRTWEDAEGRVERLEREDGAWVELRYAARGLLTRVESRTPAGAAFVTSYTYTSAGQIETLTDPDGGVTRYTYDAGHRLVRVDRPNNTSTQYEHTDFDRIRSIRHRRGETLVEEYVFDHDPHGRVIAASTPQGEFQYEYDALGRLAVERRIDGGSTVEEKRRTWDAVGNLVSVTDEGGTTTFEYDRDDRLLSSAGPRGTTAYRHSARGALTRIEAPDGTTVFSYDDLDRLIRVDLPDGESISYAYDVSGRLLSRSDNAGQRFLLPLPATPSGWGDTALTYGPGGTDPRVAAFGPLGIASIHGDPEARYVWPGHLGDVTAVTDPSGIARGSYGFDPWGNPIASEGEEFSYGFLGERQDPATGLVFLRARHYAPALGRFLTPDTFGAASRDPRTLHRYLYSLGDPLNRTDRSGRFTILETTIVTAIQTILRNLDAALKACIKDTQRRKLWKTAINWSLNQVATVVWDVLDKAVRGVLAGAGPGMTVAQLAEGGVHQKIADWFCGGGLAIANDKWVFQLKVDECGDPRTYKKDENVLWKFYACWLDPDRASKGYGIDIVYNNLIPFELKITQATAEGKEEQQVKPYCRYAAYDGYHLAFWIYAQFPLDDAFHRKLALACIGCWSGSGCPHARAVGSIYIGFGVNLNAPGGKKFQAYIPDPGICPGG